MSVLGNWSEYLFRPQSKKSLQLESAQKKFKGIGLLSTLSGQNS